MKKFSAVLAKWFFEKFMFGVTWFHMAGFLMLIFGGEIGKLGDIGSANFKFTATLCQVAGFIAFFKDLARSLFARKEPIVIVKKD